jgi:hypothetical protein
LSAPNTRRRRRIRRRPGCSTAPHDPFESRAEVRYTDAAGPPEAIADAHALFLWDFLSSDLAAHVGWGRYARNELAGQDVVEE